MKTCYDLTLELIKVMGDLERTIDKKSKAPLSDHNWLDTEINKLELKMFDIQNQLKNINI